MLNAFNNDFTQENPYGFSRVQESTRLTCVNQFLTPGLLRQFLHSTFRKETLREMSMSKAKKTYNYFCALSCIRMNLLQV